MASLYIKDAVTADRVERMARQRGTSKTALVRRALDALDQAEPLSNDDDQPPADFVDWVQWHRARHPLPPATGVKADKAFFDRLWGEPD